MNQFLVLLNKYFHKNPPLNLRAMEIFAQIFRVRRKDVQGFDALSVT